MPKGDSIHPHQTIKAFFLSPTPKPSLPHKQASGLDEAPRPLLTWPDAPAAPRAARSGFRGSGVSAPHGRSTGTSSTARAPARNAPPERRGWLCGRPRPAAGRGRVGPQGSPRTPHPRALTAMPASPPPGGPRPPSASRPHLGQEPLQSLLQLPLVLATIHVSATTEEGLAAQRATLRGRHGPKTAYPRRPADLRPFGDP